jgi:hypothetical protein
MKRLIAALLSLTAGLWLLAGCGSKPPATAAPPPAATLEPQPTLPEVAPTAAATAVPAPSKTPAPPSPLPAATQTPVFTLTPTELPTPDPNLGAGEVVYEDKFDLSSGWGWTYQENDVVAFSLAGGMLNAVMKVGNVSPRVTGGNPELKVGDLLLRVTSVTNLCYDNDEYGVMFRVNAEATDGYLFELSCEGKARVEALHNYQPTVLVDWTASPAIVRNAPAENTLMVWAAKDTFHFYVNDRYLFTTYDGTYKEGTFGFYIYDRTSGGESVSFDNLIVKAVTPSP